MAEAIRSKPLIVRRRLWCQNGEPKLEILMPDGWRPVRSYEKARMYAKHFGRSGIRVRVIG